MSVDEDIRQVLEICKGDYKAALPLVLVANAFYAQEIERLKIDVGRLWARQGAQAEPEAD